MVTRDSRVRMVTGVVFSEVQGEMVLFKTVNGRYYGLDAVGGRIWQLLQCESDLGRLHARLIEEYEYDACGVPPWSDVADLVEALAARGLLSIVDPDCPEGFDVQPLDSEASDVARGRPFDSEAPDVARGRPLDSEAPDVARGRPLDSEAPDVARGRQAAGDA